MEQVEAALSSRDAVDQAGVCVCVGRMSLAYAITNSLSQAYFPDAGLLGLVPVISLVQI